MHANYGPYRVCMLLFIIASSQSPWEKWIVKKAQEELTRRQTLKKQLVSACAVCNSSTCKSIRTYMNVALVKAIYSCSVSLAEVG